MFKDSCTILTRNEDGVGSPKNEKIEKKMYNLKNKFGMYC